MVLVALQTTSPRSLETKHMFVLCMEEGDRDPCALSLPGQKSLQKMAGQKCCLRCGSHRLHFPCRTEPGACTLTGSWAQGLQGEGSSAS